ncbi:cytochrome f [Lyngbya confervoides]|uniref:Cytochrome f n=1 Tax=Lyngbya confervoides BDU141951 TaxID=1574623 RepID=A0ABD4T5E8_9CYAN|nr:apocytochrome f [Lyngbya confervoides]MCM1983866.1 apocytochrome f [Lyngbya confervoides BDU141951]
MKKKFLPQVWSRGAQFLSALALFLASSLVWPQPAQAYPFWAQAAYENPREPTGRIVCANCHLAAKPTELEVPQSVKPDTVFKAVVKIPYEQGAQQVLGDGSKGPLNVGAVMVLPEGFTLAPQDRLSEELQEETKGVYIQPYAEDKQNILIVGPLAGDDHQEIVFPILSPNPAADKSVNYGKYSIHAGGNRGRGQVYPTGEKSNNNIFTASTAGVISEISASDAGGYQVAIQTAAGETVTESIPAGPELLVSQGQSVAEGDALTSNPNVGGFGQHDTEIVLQNPTRVLFLIVFFIGIMLSQTMLVLKKKQIEKVQAAEMNF